MFTDPPLARVGLSEGEAQRQGVNARVAKLAIVAVLRSRTVSQTRGFVKALVEADGDRVLGFAMFGAEAGEVMAVVQTAMLAGLILRGVAFEYRYKTERMRWVWDAGFAGGSLVAAFMQGMTVGALVEELPISNGHYTGGEFDWFNSVFRGKVRPTADHY